MNRWRSERSCFQFLFDRREEINNTTMVIMIMIMTLGKLPPDLETIRGENIQEVGQGDKTQTLSNPTEINLTISRIIGRLELVLEYNISIVQNSLLKKYQNCLDRHVDLLQN